MPAFEIRAIAYGLLALIFIGGCGWGGYTLAAHHYQRIEALQQIAQDKALQDAQTKVIAAQAAQKAAEDRANVESLARQQADTASRNTVLSSVRGLESALHIGSLSASVDHSGGQVGSATGGSSDPELERAVANLNDATAKAIAACQHDSEHLAYILSIAPKVTP